MTLGGAVPASELPAVMWCFYVAEPETAGACDFAAMAASFFCGLVLVLLGFCLLFGLFFVLVMCVSNGLGSDALHLTYY